MLCTITITIITIIIIIIIIITEHWAYYKICNNISQVKITKDHRKSLSERG